MSERPSKSCVRDSHGPRTVDNRAPTETQRDNERSGRSTDDTHRRHKRSTNERKRRPSTGPTSKRKATNPYSNQLHRERPTFRLDVVGHPPRTIALGTSVDASVIISLQFSTADNTRRASNYDTTRLLAVASLVADTRVDRVPMEAGALSGQQLFDSVHALPAGCAEGMVQSQPCRLPLGHVSFGELLIRQSGCYRIRVTLIQLPAPGSACGAASVTAVDSEVVRVERRPAGNQYRRHQRVYG